MGGRARPGGGLDSRPKCQSWHRVVRHGDTSHHLTTAVVTAVGTLFVEGRRKTHEKIEQRDLAAAKLLRALRECEEYIAECPGMPNEQDVWASQREVRDAAQAYADACRSVLRVAFLRRPSKANL